MVEARLERSCAQLEALGSQLDGAEARGEEAHDDCEPDDEPPQAATQTASDPFAPPASIGGGAALLGGGGPTMPAAKPVSAMGLVPGEGWAP